MTDPSATESSLINGILAGDEKAAKYLSEKIRPMLIRFSHQRGISIEDAEDLAQEVLLACISQLQAGRAAQFRNASSLTTWIIGIFKHKVADLWRRRAREGKSFAEMSPPPANGERAILSSGSTSIELDVCLGVREAVRKLPIKSRAVLILHETEGYTLEQIAALMGMSVAGVYRALRAAREMLRSAL